MKILIEIISSLVMLVATLAYLPPMPSLKAQSTAAVQNVAAEQWVSVASWPLPSNQNGINPK